MHQGTVLLKEYALTWNESSQLTGQLLIALCDLSLEVQKNSDEGYISIELADGVSKIRGRKWIDIGDGEVCSDRVRKYWNQLLALWETKQDGIQQYLADKGINAIPHLEKIEGGGSGIQSRYFIAWSKTNQTKKSREIAESAYDKFSIRYVREDISSPGFVTRFFSKGLNVSGWRRYLFAAWVSVPIIVGVLGIFTLLAQIQLWDHFGSEQVFKSIITVSLLLLGLWITAGSFINLPDNRIVVAPLWLQSEFNDRLIELIKEPNRTVIAVHYSARCPICHGKVNAMSGKWEFRGRIVGRCENAPVEHVFSFDHVTRSGKSLRN